MALTDTRPETDAAPDAVAPAVVPSPLTIFGSGDHKAIGTFYVLAALVFAVGGAVATVLSSAHRLGSGSFLSEVTAKTITESTELGLVLLVLIPFVLGLATYIVPLQVGASTVAFPRAAAAAMWTWLLSSGVFVVSLFIGGGFDGDRAKSIDLTLLSLGGVVVALLIGTVCAVTTAITLRSPGMTLDRVPVFTFSILVAGSIWLLTLPVLLANLLIIWVDHRYGGSASFAVTNLRSGQTSWLSHQPQVYASIIPVLGIAADVIATLTGARLARRNLLLVAIGAFGVLSIGAWAQSALYPNFADEFLWQAMGLLAILPVLMVLAGVAVAFKSGKPSLQSPLGLAVVSLVLVLLATLAGALLVVTPFELRADNQFAFGQFLLVVAAGLTGGIAGLGYWAPKMTGGRAVDSIGKLNVLVLLGAGVLSGLPWCILGFSTRFSGIDNARDALIVVSMIGSALLALGALLAVASLLSGARKGAPEAGDNPWGTGQTLEWACSSPPPTGNFGDLAVVRSPEPLLDEEA